MSFYLMWMRNYQLTFAEIDEMRLEVLMDLMIVDAKIKSEPLD